MKKLSKIFLLNIVLILIYMEPSSAVTKAGSACKKFSQVVVSDSYLYTCSKLGNKLIWKKGMRVQVESTSTGSAKDIANGISGSSETQGNSATVSQQNAIRKAKSYLSFSAFSRTGLIKQLEFEGFSNSDAVFGVDAQNANWSTQAILKAKRYLDISGYSRSGLIKQLEFDGFETSDAIIGADSQNTNWNEQASKKAKSYLSYSGFSRSGLIRQLEFEGFTSEQAIFGVNTTGL